MALRRSKSMSGASREWRNVIVNFHSGKVLDMSDNSLKNYATVRQFPFNGGDSQSWQLFN
jgi:Ricin-type beta-trefoil lectin domain-like